MITPQVFFGQNGFPRNGEAEFKDIPMMSRKWRDGSYIVVPIYSALIVLLEACPHSLQNQARLWNLLQRFAGRNAGQKASSALCQASREGA